MPQALHPFRQSHGTLQKVGSVVGRAIKSQNSGSCWWLEIEWRRLSTISSVCCEQVAKQQSDLSVLLFSAKRYGK